MQNSEYAGLDIIERRDGRLDYDIFQVCDDRIGDHDKNRGMLVKNFLHQRFPHFYVPFR